MNRSSRLTLAGVIFAVISLPCAAKERVFSPVAGEGQEIRFSDGQAVLITGNGLGNIAVSYVPLDKKWGFIRLWVENASDQQFNISEGSLTASSGGAPLIVMTYADQVKAQKRKEMWAAVLTGVAAGANSYSASQAGYSNYSGNYRARTTAGAYSANTYGSYNGRSYNGGIAYLAQANAAVQNQAMFDRFHSMASIAAQSLQVRSLKANTLMPRQSVLGDVRLALPKGAGAEMLLKIDLAGQPVDVVFHEGPPVVDSTPHPVATPAQPPMRSESYPVPSIAPQSALIPASAASMDPETEEAKSIAYANPSGPAARVELIKLGCDRGFNLISSAAGHAIFEATCGGGKRQLMECYGNGCRPLN